MGIYKRGRTWWASYQKRGLQERVSLRTSSKQVAQIRYAELMRTLPKQVQKDIERGRPLTLEQFLARFRDFVKSEKAFNTCKRYEIAIRHLRETHPEINMLAQITPLVIQDVKNKLIRDGKKAGNTNRLVQALKTMMRTAENWELVPQQKWQTVSKLKQKKGRVVFHTEEEIQAMLEAVPNDWYRLIIKLGCRAGLRRGEMAELRWEDIDFQKNEIYIRANKTENFRHVPISADLRAELMRQPVKTGYVVREIGRCPRESSYFITAAYTREMKRLGIDSFPHKLRHTFASHLVQKGVELYTVSKLMGHSSIKMTEIYAHLSPRTMQSAIDVLP